MMQPRPLALLTFVLLIGDAGLAQTPSLTSDPQAVLLLQSALAKLTGSQPVSDVTLTGTASRIAGSDTESGSVTLRALAAGQSRMDLSLTAGARSEVRGGTGGQPAGAWSDPTGAVHEMANHNLWMPSAWFFPAFIGAQFLSNSSYVVAYVGQEAREGVTVAHLRASIRSSGTPDATTLLIQNLTQTEIYLDSSTLLPVAVTFNIHPDRDAGLNIPAEVRFSDYRSLNGAQVPFHVQEYVQYGLVLDLQIHTVTFNNGLSASAFVLQ
jgi:hypothetical protein